MVALARSTRQAVPVTLQQLAPADVTAASMLLTETSLDRTRAELSADLQRHLDAWPMLQLGAFGHGGELLAIATGVIDEWDLRVGWSFDVVVAEQLRGMGIGTALMQAQLGSFAELGVERVRGEMTSSLMRRRGFFERLGFRTIQHITALSERGLTAPEEVIITEIDLRPSFAS